MRLLASLTAASVALLAACALMPAGEPIPFDRRPVPAADPGSTLPEGWQHGAFMEIFVRAWRDSDGDGIGDLRGLTESLPYLQELGVKGIWLMPITRSADHDHGYAVTDFRGIEPAYGTLADFDALIREAHARGIGVIMDYVINHAAREHPAFRLSTASTTDALRDWFIWQPEAPSGWDVWGKHPWYPAGGAFHYATFGPHMPDFNLRSPRALAYHHDSLRFWLNRGLDGFRFDAVPHLIENSAKDWNDQPESHALMRDVRALMRDGYRQRWMVCEATANPQRWAGADSCGAAFAFGLEHQLIDAARGKTEAIQRVAAYFTSAPPTMATMLSNHDIFAGKRLRDQLGADDAAYRLAAATYLLLPGTPFIYYGEEIGMAGVDGLPGDAPLRTPMSWTADPASAGGFTRPGVKPFRPASDNAATHNVAAQRTDPASVLAHYKTLLALRNGLPSIAVGRYEAPQVAGQAMAFQRATDDEHTLVLINYGKAPATIRIDRLGANARYASEYPAGGARTQADADGRVHFALAPQSFRVLRRER